ncbi:MAG: sulfotransferase family 2 domain-containing protein [Dinoroseobacter sp.]|nr:sulfotransferase family 2 domain-containing protein [Dinoroseobacter sp.]
MLVFHNQSLVILSIPKTGNTALESALAPHASLAVLGPPDVRHMPWRIYRNSWLRFLEAQFGRKFETLAVVRDPLDRMRSWYRYRARQQFDGSKMSTADMSFDEFIEASLQPDPPAFARIWTQDKFVSSKAEQIRVTHLFDYAQMDKLVIWLSERLNRDIELACENVSPSKPTPLSPAWEKALRDARAGEFALYSKVAQSGYLRT